MNEITSLAGIAHHRERWTKELADPSRQFRRSVLRRRRGAATSRRR